MLDFITKAIVSEVAKLATTSALSVRITVEECSADSVVWFQNRRAKFRRQEKQDNPIAEMPPVKQGQIPSWSWMAQQSNTNSNEEFPPPFSTFDQKPVLRRSEAVIHELHAVPTISQREASVQVWHPLACRTVSPRQPVSTRILHHFMCYRLAPVGLPNGLSTPTGFHQNPAPFHVLPYPSDNHQLDHHLESFPNLS
ncbi:hypothetical protein OSTOST_07046 [Ostertagia ostertagi]